MAESRWDRTGPNGIARAEVRNLTPPHLDDVVRSVADDGHAYEPLHVPGPLHGISPPSTPPPPVPTEESLREVLEQSIASRDFAAANLQRAAEVSARATAYREQCEIRLRDEYATTDDDVTAHTVQALRGNGRADLPDELHKRLAERGQCRDALAAATRAEAVLAEALVEAKAEAAAATKAANTAAATLSHVLAAQLAAKVAELETEAARIKDLLFGADVVGVATPLPLRPIFGDGSRFLKPVNRGPWQALRQRLLADPQALLELIEEHGHAG